MAASGRATPAAPSADGSVSHAEDAAEHVNWLAKKKSPQEAAHALLALLDSHTNQGYRGTLCLNVDPAILTLAVGATRAPDLAGELTELNAEDKRERHGFINGVSGWVIDRFSHRGHHVDESVKAANGFDEKARKDGFLSTKEITEEQGLINKAQHEQAGYKGLRTTLGDNVAMTLSTVGALAATEMSAPVPIVMGVAAAAGAAGEVAFKALIEGSDYTSKEAVRDAAIGAVSGVAAKLSNKFTQRMAQRLATRFGVTRTLLASGTMDGAIVGSAQGAAFGAVQDKTWRDGAPRGLLRVLEQTAAIGGTTAATGLGMGVFRTLRYGSGKKLSELLGHLENQQGPLHELSPEAQKQLRELVLGENNPFSVQARGHFSSLVRGRNFQRMSPAEKTEALRAFIDDPRLRPSAVRTSLSSHPRRAYTLTEVPSVTRNFGERVRKTQEYVLALEGHAPIRLSLERAGAMRVRQPGVQRVADALADMPSQALDDLRTVRVHARGEAAGGVEASATAARQAARRQLKSGELDLYARLTPGGSLTLRADLLRQYGHVLAAKELDDPAAPFSKAWKSAIREDSFGASRFAFGGPKDDFAETVALYLSVRGSKAYEECARLLPHRFAQLRQLLGP